MSTQSKSQGAEQRVLIYRLGSLGDMVVALPCLHLIAKVFPAAERRMLTNFPVNAKAPAAAAVLGSQPAECELVHGYMQYTAGVRRVGQLVKLWWQIVRWSPDVVVYLAASRGVKTARRDARFFRACGVRRLIGVPLTEGAQQNFYDAPNAFGFLTTVPGAIVLGRDREPEAERLARCIADLGDAQVDDPASWDLHLTESERVAALAAIGVEALSLEPIGVCVGTKVQAKDWGAANWRHLLGLVAREFPGRALVLVGAAEEFAASDVATADWSRNGGGPVVNLCGRLNPRESAGVLENMTMFLGHDSGPLHLAAAVGTPCVAVFSARNMPRVWYPFGEQHRVVQHMVECAGCGLETCIEKKKRCLTSISVEDVLQAVRELAAGAMMTTADVAVESRR